MRYVVIAALSLTVSAAPIPEERFAVPIAPAEIARMMSSKSAAERQIVVKALHWEPGDFPPIPGVVLINANLDSDPEPEAIIRIDVVGTSQAMVFDQSGGQWWHVGGEGTRWRYHPDSANRFLDLATDPKTGRADILIRKSAGGTEFSVLELRVYRLIKGKLQMVFMIDEKYHQSGWGSDKIIDEQRDIQMTPPDRIIVRQLKKAGCTMYRFNAVRVEFLATAERCP